MLKTIFYILLSGVLYHIPCTSGGNIAVRGKGIKHGPFSISEHGINVATEAYEAVCWYEFLKKYVPKTRSLDFNQCLGQASFQRKMILKQRVDEKYFGQFLFQFAMGKLPDSYKQCSPYLLENRYSRPKRDYSSVFNDTSGLSFESYPYQAFAHCLASVLHEKNKDDGLQQFKERLAQPKSWTETMFERENEFRALHQSPPLVINDELTRRAQKWANQLAKDCQMYHIHNSHPDYYLNGSRMGENLFTGDGIHNLKEDMALFGTNIWYEEIEHYPWPEYKGFGEDPFYKFAHFTQMIWKDTKEVGYGYAINDSESCGQYFIVARYFPPGNFWESFKENVLPLSYPDATITTTNSNISEE